MNENELKQQNEHGKGEALQFYHEVALLGWPHLTLALASLASTRTKCHIFTLLLLIILDNFK